MRLRVLCGPILLVSYAPACAQEPNANQKTLPTFRTESSASIIEGHNARTYVTENHSFRFEEGLGDTGKYEAVLLLEEIYHNERTSGLESSAARDHCPASESQALAVTFPGLTTLLL